MAQPQRAGAMVAAVPRALQALAALSPGTPVRQLARPAQAAPAPVQAFPGPDRGAAQAPGPAAQEAGGAAQESCGPAARHEGTDHGRGGAGAGPAAPTAAAHGAAGSGAGANAVEGAPCGWQGDVPLAAEWPCGAPEGGGAEACGLPGAPALGAFLAPGGGRLYLAARRAPYTLGALLRFSPAALGGDDARRLLLWQVRRPQGPPRAAGALPRRARKAALHGTRPRCVLACSGARYLWRARRCAASASWAASCGQSCYARRTPHCP